MAQLLLLAAAENAEQEEQHEDLAVQVPVKSAPSRLTALLFGFCHANVALLAKNTPQQSHRPRRRTARAMVQKECITSSDNEEPICGRY